MYIHMVLPLHSNLQPVVRLLTHTCGPVCTWFKTSITRTEETAFRVNAVAIQATIPFITLINV